MKRITLLVAAIAIGTAASASGGGQPGAKFLESWDMNEDGQVTLEEATERRGDIFYTFDENDDGILNAQEYVLFDAARAADHADGDSRQGGQGGQGNQKRASVGMEMDFNDTDNDGNVSREEFLTRSSDWFEILDRNGDGTITTADFGRRG